MELLNLQLVVLFSMLSGCSDRKAPEVYAHFVEPKSSREGRNMAKQPGFQETREDREDSDEVNTSLHTKTLDFAKLNSIELADRRIARGKVHMEVGQYDSALHHLFGAIKLLENIHVESTLAQAYMNLGLVYQKLRDHKRAIEYYQHAEILFHTAGDNRELPLLYIEIGLAHADSGSILDAFESFKKAYSECTPDCSSALLSQIMFAEGKAFLARGHWFEAKGKLEVSLSMAREIGNEKLIAENHVSLSRLYSELGEADLANQLLGNAEAIACRKGFNQLLLDVYRERIKVSAALQDNQSVVEYQGRFIELSERMFNEEILGKLAALEIDFAERENNNLIGRQTQSLVLSQKTIEKKERLILLAGLCLVLGLVTVAMLFRVVRRKKRTIGRLMTEVEDGTLILERRLKEHAAFTEWKALGSRAAISKLKADVASLIGICHVASKSTARLELKRKYDRISGRLDRVKHKLEGL